MRSLLVHQNDDEGDALIAAAGRHPRVGLTVRASSWRTRSTRAWTTVCETAQHYYSLTVMMVMMMMMNACWRSVEMD